MLTASCSDPCCWHSARNVVVRATDGKMLRYVRDTLTAAGYAVVVTGDHAQLSRTIRIERPHLVLLDLVLPGADGIALMGSVPELADLLVVFISGYRPRRDDRRGPEGGRHRLPGQALLADRADRPRRRGASPRLPARAVRPRRAGHPLCASTL